jgi:hypothetical protein
VLYLLIGHCCSWQQYARQLQSVSHRFTHYDNMQVSLHNWQQACCCWTHVALVHSVPWMLRCMPHCSCRTTGGCRVAGAAAGTQLTQAAQAGCQPAHVAAVIGQCRHLQSDCSNDSAVLDAYCCRELCVQSIAMCSRGAGQQAHTTALVTCLLPPYMDKHMTSGCWPA